MRVIRPLFTCLTVLFLFSNIVFSQSSIYKDAKELATFLNTDNSISIYLKKSSTSNAFLNLKLDRGKDTLIFNTGKVDLPFGYNDIEVKNWESTDTLNIVFPDTLISLGLNDSNLIRTPMKNLQGADLELSITDKISVEHFLISFYPNYYALDVFFTASEGNTSVPLVYNRYYKKKNDLEPYSQILKILNTHTNFGLVDKGVDLTFQKTQFEYALNPFFNNLSIDNPLLSPGVDRYFSSEFRKKNKDNFADHYYKNNPWHKLLYGDSLLNFQKTVSFKDASSTYRTRIVTSQNELTDASIRINETNKRKNLLDAKTVAVGLSDFIAERAQEELNLTFFNRFKQNLEKPSELTVLFPNTKNLLYQFEISNYKTLLSHARESFKVDLDNLGLNFPEVLKLNKYKNLYNSPEVFNLSLIYSIADLAYKEEPVENILVAAYQRLKERKQDLNKSINVELADNFIASVTPNGAKKSSITSQQIQNSTELQRLKKYVDEYLNAVEESKNKLLEVKVSELDDLFLNTSAMLSSQLGGISFKDHGRINSTNSNLSKKFELIKSDFYRPIQYNNRRINEYSLLNFYRKTVQANLNGKEYYGYLIENPYPEDYQLYFKPAPDSINSILAEGIEGSRNLLAESFDDIIHENYGLLIDASKVYRKITKEYILRLENLAGPEKKINELINKVNLLKSAIDYEIIFWKKITQQDSTDHHIAGLYFLKALIKQDVQINLFYEVANLIKLGSSYNTLVENFYPNTLGKDYKKNMNLTLNQLDTLQFDFNDKVEALTREFGSINLTDSTYQHQLLTTQFHIDTIAVNKKLERTAFDYDDWMKLLNNVASESLIEPGEEILSYEDKAPKIAEVADEIYMHVIGLNSSDLKFLAQELEEETDDAKKENINKQIRELNDERDLHEIAIDSILDVHLEKLENLKKTEIAKLTPEKEALFTEFQNKMNALKGSSTPKNLRDIYSLENNPFLEKYRSRNQIADQINFHEREEMFNINYLDLQLDTVRMVLDKLKEKRQQLKNHFNQLDTTYCKNLVEANTNAQNLAKSLEFSTHLLFAFRDYERIYDTVFVYDSSYVEITINQLDSLTKFTNTIKRDSLIIRKKPIDGTTEPLIAARWITRKEFDDLRKNELQWNLFLGLLYQRLRSIEDAPNFSAEGVALLATKFLSITHDMDTYRSNLRRKKATTPDLVTFKDYYPFIRSTVDLFNTVITTPSIADTSATVSNKFGLENIPQISNEALSLYENIYVKEYGNAVLNAMELLKIISNKKLGKKEARKSQRSINAVLTYGTFMANMINAQTSDQVKNILKSATLPPGSSRIKRETLSSFTINSYLGAAVGRDRLLGVPENIDLAQDAFGISLSVPIGFTYSFSPNIIKNNSSFSIHVPLIDLGAITAYRQNPDNPDYSIDNLPDFSWQNLFSPGVFAVYNFENSPFSLGVGGQYGPQLRQITPTGGEAINVNSWRFPMAFFTIDVPFFNLHTGARKIIVD